MKRSVIILASALTAAGSGAALAAMGTTQFGLPQGWNMGTSPTRVDRGYGAAMNGINGNPGSAMCVECHTVNPSAFIVDISSPNAGYVVGRTAQFRGTHTVMNDASTSGTANNPWGTTNTGGGWTAAVAGVRDDGAYMRGAAWASGAVSKYNSGTSLNSVLETTPVDTTNADLICESCHNIITNTVNAGTDNDLLVGTYYDNRNDSLCLGCHANNETVATATYQGFHGNDNLKAFDGTRRKRHHVLTGDVLADANYGTGGTDSLMWAPSASNRLTSTWCATPYNPVPGTITNLDLATGAPIEYRGLCNVAGQGTKAIGTGVDQVSNQGDILAVSNTTVNCSNCHRPHNAMSTSGAFIFRMGDQTKGNFAGNTSANFPATADNMYYGLRRQSDVDQTYALKVYQEYRPLCAGCHFGY